MDFFIKFILGKFRMKKEEKEQFEILNFS